MPRCRACDAHFPDEAIETSVDGFDACPECFETGTIEESESVTEADVFAYLDTLRESGATNMFGAGQYLQWEFGLSRNEARDWLKKWMEARK